MLTIHILATYITIITVIWIEMQLHDSIARGCGVDHLKNRTNLLDVILRIAYWCGSISIRNVALVDNYRQSAPAVSCFDG